MKLAEKIKQKYREKHLGQPEESITGYDIALALRNIFYSEGSNKSCKKFKSPVSHLTEETEKNHQHIEMDC